jgi:20S proteasome alpha/beta subunit
MSLGIAFKGPEGIVLAADSRVTLTSTLPDGTKLTSSFDNATKLLQVKDQDNVGVVTYGVGAFGDPAPRTAHSYLPELERELAGRDRLSVADFAGEISTFFQRQWTSSGMPATGTDDMWFLIAGYDPDATYGRVFQLRIPSSPTPDEQMVGNQFGLTYGGQHEVTSRLLAGFDPRVGDVLKTALGITDVQVAALWPVLQRELQLPIPWQFLPLQDCVDLAIFLVRTTATIQNWLVGIRGVGGAIDVATITRTEGFRALQRKEVKGGASGVAHS